MNTKDYKETAWWSADGFYRGWVKGVIGGTWSFEIVEFHDYGEVPVSSGSGYGSEQEAFKTMSSAVQGEELIRPDIWVWMAARSRPFGT